MAWADLGWRPAFVSEIASFPCKVLAHHYPDVTNHGDFSRITRSQSAGIDLLVGGTPCQSFSVAGLRRGLDDARGALALEFLRLADQARPRWIVWENVPGVLSADGGRALGAFLGGMEEIGYGWAYRVLDAQYFGVPQRRRRVFVVGCSRGTWNRPAAVLFDPASMRGDPPPSRAPGAETAGTAQERAGGGLAPCLTRSLGRSCGVPGDPTGVGAGGLIPFDPTQITSWCNRANPQPGAPAYTLAKSGNSAIAFHTTQDPISGPVSPCIGRQTGGMGVQTVSGVRRLTPRECERLQGFPDDYTAIPKAKDGPRYAALGNSMAVPVMRWIGERIAMVDALTSSLPGS